MRSTVWTSAEMENTLLPGEKTLMSESMITQQIKYAVFLQSLVHSILMFNGVDTFNNIVFISIYSYFNYLPLLKHSEIY